MVSSNINCNSVTNLGGIDTADLEVTFPFKSLGSIGFVCILMMIRTQRRRLEISLGFCLVFTFRIALDELNVYVYNSKIVHPRRYPGKILILLRLDR